MGADEVDELFNAADSDANGYIDAKEFSKWVLEDESAKELMEQIAKMTIVLGGTEPSVAIAFHPGGAYGFTADGKYTKVSGEGAWHAQAVIPISDDELLLFHSLGLYKKSLKTNETIQLTGVMGKSDGSWSSIKCVLRCKRDPDHVLCLHSHGMYRVKIEDGSWEKLSGGFLGMAAGWSQAKEVIYDPETDMHYVFHCDGVYKVDAKEGTYEKLSKSGTWLEAHGAVYHAGGAVVFHSMATYRVNLTDGSSTVLNSGGWAGGQTAFLTGPDTAIVLHTMGTYEVNLTTGESKAMPDSWGWAHVTCATRLGADVMAASHVEQD
eukprot:TRINITY_DN16239_c0_g1_i1.p1 TRINITY_DN16239_c0_g1~~TRINITY_DN16239_c0_g1_i1.p1  ORF type:complete len:377 (+),score=70.93 TRINITY_DN16239_c0_g1_i1:166-1131(+)